MGKQQRNWMAAHLITVLVVIIAVVGASALLGCDSNPPGSACLDEGNPFCSNYVPPGSGGSGNNTNTGGTGNTAGTGGNTTPPVNCGALPNFNCFGECVVLTTDEANCGSCGRECGSGQSCVDGYCTWNTPPDQCVQSSEACDGIDNDCDLAIDEEFNLFTDEANCGTCGRACGSGQSCVNGHCTWDEPQNGCVSSTETCNGVDDDCDTAIDEPFNLLADTANCGVCGNVCGTGQHCSNGHCALDVPDDQCVPSAEVCDSVDNDCDGTIDDGFNLLTDAQNCGMCGHACDSLQSCVSGHCAWDTPIDECVPAVEICDNADNDCDGAIDETTNLLSDPQNCGMCGRACDTGALCLNAVCFFSTPVDQCTPLPAELCNSRDDNCNGWVDEGYNLLTDSQNCGMCGRDCGGGAVCDNGRCQLITPILNCTPAPEVCDYTDNDCDGQIDELINLQTDETNCGVCGLACAAEQVCDTGHCQWISPQVGCTPAPETCNGVDDDCDGVIDDGFSLLNDPLNCGACGRACGANQHCQNGACALDVPNDQCVPSAEICDSVDNNCNTVIDEGINLSTDNANCGVCGRVCPAGQVCQSGACSWITPPTNCTPAPETCNGVDDDCDGAIDDGFVLTNDEANCGVCGHACGANQVCDNGHCAWITPPPGCAPAPETCNGVDDDCDGILDDGFNLSNDPLNCGLCGFVCAAGQYCLNGHCAWEAPVNVCMPANEVCNNVDDNCNGLIDEGITLATDPANCGTCGRVCAPGQSCQAGQCSWNVPQDGCVAVAEVCDNADNDCDTVIDEGFDLQNDALNCGKCGRTCAANQHCQDGTCAWNTPVSQCVPSAEICDNADNDCDGLIDEGIALLSDSQNCGTCGHVCGAGQICQNGYCSWLIPVSTCGPPSSEVCDNTDNDCDGFIDEGYDLLLDESNCGHCGNTCAAGQYCSNGACAWTVPVSSCVPAPETCDNTDNDCNQLIDNGFNLSIDESNCGQCGTACGVNQSCWNGHCAWNVPLNGCTPVAELCNNIDDDCDGAIDENFSLSSDNANCGICGRVCAAGQFCSGGKCQWSTPPAGCSPVAESCNYSDDDCDGIIDDGFNLSSNSSHCGACGHACAAGQFCQNAHCTWVIPQSSCVAAAESCNSIDDDCDGAIDENWNFLSDKSHCGNCWTVCPGTQYCQNGQCRLP